LLNSSLCVDDSPTCAGDRRQTIWRRTHHRLESTSRSPEARDEFGATDIVDTRGDQAIEDVKKLTDGVGVGAALECVGTNEAMHTAIGICRAGAIVGKVGLPHHVEISPLGIFVRNVGVHGVPRPCGPTCPI
jgi:threonine dehydrogenase-like Zn-dependent dehydrogenase